MFIHCNTKIVNLRETSVSFFCIVNESYLCTLMLKVYFFFQQFTILIFLKNAITSPTPLRRRKYMCETANFYNKNRVKIRRNNGNQNGCFIPQAGPTNALHIRPYSSCFRICLHLYYMVILKYFIIIYITVYSIFRHNYKIFGHAHTTLHFFCIFATANRGFLLV